MNWCDKVTVNTNTDELDHIIESVNTNKIKITKLNIERSLEIVSPIAQLYTMPNIYGEFPMSVDIPIGNTLIKEKILNEIAPHFTKVLLVEDNGQEIISLKNIKNETMDMLNDLVRNENVHPLAYDLYCAVDSVNSKLVSKTYTNEVQIYEVNKPQLQAIEELYYDIQVYFSEVYVSKSFAFTVCPTNWSLNDNLKNSISLRFFNWIFNKTKIIVNQNKKVMHIEFS